VCFSGWSRLVLQSNQFFSDHFPSLVSEVISALRVFTMLNTHMNSLGKTLALNLVVHDNANSMLGNTADSSSSAAVTLGAFLFEQYL
jgi:hypothetical protein